MLQLSRHSLPTFWVASDADGCAAAIVDVRNTKPPMALC